MRRRSCSRFPVLAGKSLPADKLFMHRRATRQRRAVLSARGNGAWPGPGRGTLSASRLPAARGLLVVPAIHSSTAEAYRDLSPRLTSIPLQNKLNSFQQEVWRGGGDGRIAVDDNDFEEVVFARHPELKRIKAAASPFRRETCGHDGKRLGDLWHFRGGRTAGAREKVFPGKDRVSDIVSKPRAISFRLEAGAETPR